MSSISKLVTFAEADHFEKSVKGEITLKFNLNDFIEANSCCGGPGHVFVLFKNHSVSKYRSLKLITGLYLDSVDRIFGSKWANVDPQSIHIMSDDGYVSLGALNVSIKSKILVGAENHEEYGIYMNDIVLDLPELLEKLICLFVSNPLTTRQSVPNIDIELSLTDTVDIERMMSKNKELQKALRKEMEQKPL